MTRAPRLLPLMACLFACRPASDPSPPGAAAPPGWGELSSDPQDFGPLVYRGDVFDPEAPAGQPPPFRYERRALARDDEQLSTHATFDPEGSMVVLQRARHGRDYALVAFRQLHAQTGSIAELDVRDDGELRFAVTDGDRTRRRRERVDGPVVVGPTLFGYVSTHWDALLAGRAGRIHFAAVERSRTYRFHLAVEHADAETTTFVMTAKSPLLRAVMAPMRLVFDTRSRTIVRYEGRVPPMLEGRRRPTPLDARVEYEHVAATYR